MQDRDKPFKSPLGDIMFPGDPTAKPGNVYNCRCTITCVYPEYASTMTRRDNESGEIIRDMTYQEWEEHKKGLLSARQNGKMQDEKLRINLQLFAEKDLANQTIYQLQSGIESYMKRIQEHEYKVAHPEEFYADWNQVSDVIKAGRIRHWKKEMKNFKESIRNREDEIRKRGEK